MNIKIIALFGSVWAFMGLYAGLYSSDLHHGYFTAFGLVFGFVFTSILKDV